MDNETLYSKHATIKDKENNITIKEIICDIEINNIEFPTKISIYSSDKDLFLIDNRAYITVQITDKDNWDRDYIALEIENALTFKDEFNLIFENRYKLELHPAEIVKRHIKNNTPSTLKTDVNFYIDEAPKISRTIIKKGNKKDSVTHKKNSPIKYKISKKITLKSDYYLRELKENNTFTLNYIQILSTHIRNKNTPIKEIREEIIPHIDDFLQLVSLTEGYRVSCSKWTYTKNNEITTVFRCRKNNKNQIKKNYYDNVIRKQNTSLFLETAMKNFTSSPYKKSITNAINSLLLPSNTAVELLYLAYFQAFESNILTYKRIKNKEFIFELDKFKEIRKSIESVINNSLIPCKEERGLLKSKLTELNRPSIQEISIAFLHEFEIDLSDLWPLFNNGDKLGLSTIRNKIIHGDSIHKDHFQHLIIAHEHLKVTLYRVTLRLLGWDGDLGDISPKSLSLTQHFFNKENLEKVISEISTSPQ